MSNPKKFPVFTLAANAVLVAARSALAFLSIYLLPTIIYTIALVVARVAWFEHSGQQYAFPLWGEVVLWTPFAALISIAFFRYVDTGGRPHWWDGFALGPGFWAVAGLLLVVNFVYEHLPYWENEFAQVIWRLQFGPDWARVAIDNQQLAALSRFAVQIGGLAVNALVGMIAMGLVWVIATRNRVDHPEFLRLVSLFPLSLFLYLLLFEVITYQIGALYNAVIYGSGILHSVWPDSQVWRERVLPEFFRVLPFLPYGYISNLVWFAAIAVAYRHLDGKRAGPDARVA